MKLTLFKKIKKFEPKGARTKKGIAIFIAVITVSALTLIALAISEIAYKEQIISASGRDSRIAFYASSTGLECALFHDLRGGAGATFTFETPTTPQSGDLVCNAVPIVPHVVPGSSVVVSTFHFNFSDTPKACTVVRVVKSTNNEGGFDTLIESRGYNNHCVETVPTPNPTIEEGPRNLERSLQETY